jgi:putative oxygen-independent coproporphyrinogen III oxidase
MPLGLYISVPFCRTKCSFCNFASGVFSRALFDKYVAQVSADIDAAEAMAEAVGGVLDRQVDSVYLGGGTPSVLAPDQLEQIFQKVRDNFDTDPAAEITVECAPGTISDEILEALLRCGVNRVSLGVQSFVDRESSSVGRLHTREITLQDIARLRGAGISNISIDLIAGLPHQNAESWEYSLGETLASGVPHVSVYMLEVDEDSRLGNELLAGGSRYHAHFVPDDDLTADLYLAARERLNNGGVKQYEISNFARAVTNGIGLRGSRHNLKYWTRQPYLGFGVDAHSMLWVNDGVKSDQGGSSSRTPLAEMGRTRQIEAVRFATPDSLEMYSLAGTDARVRTQQLKASLSLVDEQAALEESFFLGLRLNRGVALDELSREFGPAVESFEPAIHELIEGGLLELSSDRLCLTPRGRLLSNEVFARFLGEDLAETYS